MSMQTHYFNLFYYCYYMNAIDVDFFLPFEVNAFKRKNNTNTSSFLGVVVVVVMIVM